MIPGSEQKTVNPELGLSLMNFEISYIHDPFEKVFVDQQHFLDYSEHCKGRNKTSPILPRQIIGLLEGGVETGLKCVTRQEVFAYLQDSCGWYLACTKVCSRLLRLLSVQTKGIHKLNRLTCPAYSFHNPT